MQNLCNYALIGNSRAAALTGKNGSIDWCCLPEFHSPGIFAAILDAERGGSFIITPTDSYISAQQYEEDTNVVNTYFTTTAGIARLTDGFSVMTEQEKKSQLFPDHEILRIVEGISGTVAFQFEFTPRLFYGEKAPVLKNKEKPGICFSRREGIYILNTTLRPDSITISPDSGRALAQFSVKSGETVIFSFSYSNQAPAIIPELEQTGRLRMQKTIEYWQRWISRCSYSGPYQKHVRRSALTLKLLTHAPSGAIIAAPTTSIPEEIGGERNWDYRYCWLRDASFTVRALIQSGFYEEVQAYMNWILHATRLTRPELQVVYSVYGKANLKEKQLPWLSGYRSSAPVRIGNKAHQQFQLDVYGEVLDAVYLYAALTDFLDNSTRNFILGLGKVICEQWNQPDNGIWEIRTAGRHHTHSKVMAWAGLDRLVTLCKKFGWNKSLENKFSETAQLISAEIEDKGYNSNSGTYTGEFEGNDLDASLLTLPLVGYCPAGSPRMLATIDAISNQLQKNDLVYRYRGTSDGLKGDEAAFAICNFWLSEDLAMMGETARARKLFEAVICRAGPSGLLSEEIHPDSGELLGNYPQGFTHIGLINAAFAINDAIKANK